MKEKTQYSELDRFYLHSPFIHKACDRTQQVRFGAVMAAGLMLMALPLLIRISNDFVALLLTTLGLFLFVGALVQCVRGCNRLMYTPTGKPLTQGAVTYDHAACPMLRSLLEKGRCDETGIAMLANPNGGIRLEYLLSQDHQMLAVNIKRFENLMWLPFSDSVYLFTGMEAEQAIKALGID